jgi:hypothetical protein
MLRLVPRASMLRLVLLVCAAAVVTGSSRAPPRALEPPTVLFHADWYTERPDGRRPDEQVVYLLKVGGENLRFARKLPRPGFDGIEPFHRRIMVPCWTGMAYYAWKTGQIDARMEGGKLVVTKAQRKPLWRRLTGGA